MLKVSIECDLTLVPANPECDSVIALIRQHSRECLRFQKLGTAVSQEEQEKHDELRDQIEKQIRKCLFDNPWEITNIGWFTGDFLSKEEHELLLG